MYRIYLWGGGHPTFRFILDVSKYCTFLLPFNVFPGVTITDVLDNCFLVNWLYMNEGD